MSDLLTTLDDDAATESQPGSALPPIRPTDGERLMRFWRHRDETALAEVIELHSGVVWGVCSQILRRREDVEDAFQATFLILARKARSIRAADSAAGWLYRVAFRTALLARSRRQRRGEQPLLNEPVSEFDQLEAISRNEQCRLLLEEINSLPMKYRQPLVLCYLEGRTRDEAADELGITSQSVKGRLARGTRILRSRLVSRGLALSTGMAALTAAMGTAQAAAPSSALLLSTAALGTGFALKLAAGGAAAGAAKSGAAVLAEKGITSMTLIAAAKPAVGVLGACLTVGMLAVASADGPAVGEGQGGGGGPIAAAISLLAGGDVEANADEFSAELSPTRTTAPEEKSPDRGSPPPAASGRAGGGGGGGEGWNVAAPSGSVLGALPGAPAAPSVPALPGIPAVPPAPLRFAANEQAWTLMPDQPQVAALPPIFADQSSPFAATAPAASEQTLRLQGEYWALKSSGLKKKAEALKAKALKLKESGGPSADILELSAEAELTLAEVKLCEVNTLQVGSQLQTLEASQLKWGAKGVRVNMLQQQLNERLTPSPKLDVDGDFGPLTQEAVKLFQKKIGLNETGVVDAQTAAALGLSPTAGADVLKPSFLYGAEWPRTSPMTRPAPMPIEASKLKEIQVGDPARYSAKASAMASSAVADQAISQAKQLAEQMRAQADEQRRQAEKQRLVAEEQLNKVEMEKFRVEEELKEMRAMVKKLEEQHRGAEGEQK